MDTCLSYENHQKKGDSRKHREHKKIYNFWFGSEHFGISFKRFERKKVNKSQYFTDAWSTFGALYMSYAVYRINSFKKSVMLI